MRSAVVLSMSLLLFSGCNDESVGDSVVPNDSKNWMVYNTQNSPMPGDQVTALALHGTVTWVGTDQGLARLQNENWDVFTTANCTIPSNIITALDTDDHGTLWAGTSDGLVSFDGANWTIHHEVSDRFISAVLYDEINDVLWVGTDSGLIKYNGTDWIAIDDLYSPTQVFSLAIDATGTLWVGAFNHYNFFGVLYSYKGDEATSMRLDYQNLNSSFPNAIVIDEGVLWLGVSGTMGGMVARVDENRVTILDESKVDRVYHGGVFSMAGKSNDLWVASGSGLAHYNGSVWKSFTRQNSPLPDYIQVISIDESGNKWIGMVMGGLAVYRGEQRGKSM